MKKLLFIFFFGVLYFGVHAQYWNLTGNSGTTTSNFLGTLYIIQMEKRLAEVENMKGGE